MEQYPAVRLMVAHGRALAIVVGVAVPAVAVLGILLADWHWIWGPAALLAGVVIGFVFRTFVELTQIIVDMLLPQ